MKRPALLTVLAVAHLLMGLLTLAVVPYLFFLARSPGMQVGKDAAETVHFLRLGAWAMAACVPPLFAVAWGLWRARRWAWGLALLGNVLWLLALLSDMFDGQVDRDNLAVAVPFAVLLVFLLLPTVRRFVFRKTAALPGNMPALQTDKA